ncbi:MAG: enoyl-CoA hydratase-related protein [Pseudomonadota bacterium]
MSQSDLDGGTVQTQIRDTPQGPIANLVIDHPRRRNAMGPAVIASLTKAALSLGQRGDIRAVTLRGSDGMFSAGANVKIMAGLDGASAHAFITSLHHAIDAVRRLPVPVIAVIEGRCYGAAMELAAACDMRIASSDAVMGMPEVRVGIPSVIEACLLPRLIGWGRTSELLLTGRDMDADEAARTGFVERTVASIDVDKAIADWLRMILACAPEAVRSQKRILRSWEPDDRSGIAASIEAFAASYSTGEPQTYMARIAGTAKP